MDLDLSAQVHIVRCHPQPIEPRPLQGLFPWEHRGNGAHAVELLPHNIMSEPAVFARGRNSDGEDRSAADLEFIMDGPAAPGLDSSSSSRDLILGKLEDAWCPELEVQTLVDLKAIFRVQGWEFLPWWPYTSIAGAGWWLVVHNVGIEDVCSLHCQPSW